MFKIDALPIPAEFLLQLLLGGVEAEAEYTQTPTGLRIVAVAGVTATRRHRGTRIIASATLKTEFIGKMMLISIFGISSP